MNSSQYDDQEHSDAESEYDEPEKIFAKFIESDSSDSEFSDRELNNDDIDMGMDENPRSTWTAGESAGKGSHGRGSKKATHSRLQFTPARQVTSTQAPQGEWNQLKSKALSESYSASIPSTSSTVSTVSTASVSSFAAPDSFGAQMLAKMGWTGQGLGTRGNGIVTPIGVDLSVRKKQLGVGLGQELSKSQTTRSENEAAADRKAEAQRQRPSWRMKRRERKRRTYEEMIAGDIDSGALSNDEDANTSEAAPVSYMITDLSGNVLPPSAIAAQSQESSSLAREAEKSPHGDAMGASGSPFAEANYNIRLLASHYHTTLSSELQRARSLNAQLESLKNQFKSISDKNAFRQSEISKLQVLVDIIQRLNSTSLSLRGSLDVCHDISMQLDLLSKLKTEFGDCFDRLHLDNVVVSVINTSVSMLWGNWDCMSDPRKGMEYFESWGSLLLEKSKSNAGPSTSSTTVSNSNDNNNNNNHYYAKYTNSLAQNGHMSPYETLIWTQWFPHMQSAQWSVENPQVFIDVLSLWEPYIPASIMKRVFTISVWPRLSRYISQNAGQKSMRSSSSVPSDWGLSSVVFPWLEITLRFDQKYSQHQESESQQQLNQLFDLAMPVLGEWLRQIGSRSQAPPRSLDLWHQVLPAGSWEKLMVRNVVPYLRDYLLANVVVEVSDKEPEAYVWVQHFQRWQPYLKRSISGQLLDTGFAPEYVKKLHNYVTQEINISSSVLESFRQRWSSIWSAELKAYPKFLYDLEQGDSLIQNALMLESANRSSARSELPLPTSTRANTESALQYKKKTQAPPGYAGRTNAASDKAMVAAIAQDITLRSLLEDFCHNNNLLMKPSGSVTSTGHALFRIFDTESPAGLTIYMDRDVVWAESNEQWVPVAFSEILFRIWETAPC